MIRSLLASLAMLATGAAQAGSLTVNPIRLELGATQAATSMTIGNAADAPTTVQVSVHEWRHRDGVDVLEPATGRNAPIITPPMFRLVPGGSQIVRIGFASRGSNNDEGRWRLIVEEVPQTQTSAQLTPVSLAPMQIATRLRVSLPLFRLPAVARSVLDWQLDRDGSTLLVANHGSTTERIDQARLSAADSTLASIAGPVYLFPGEQRRYAVSAPVPTSARLNVQGSVPVDDHALALPAE